MGTQMEEQHLFEHDLPPLVLKARHLGGSAFCWDGFPLGLGLVVEDKPTELSCSPINLATCIPHKFILVQMRAGSLSMLLYLDSIYNYALNIFTLIPSY